MGSVGGRWGDNIEERSSENLGKKKRFEQKQKKLIIAHKAKVFGEVIGVLRCNSNKLIAVKDYNNDIP
jgi:hypothetical protein